MLLTFFGLLLLTAAAALASYRAGVRAGSAAELARFGLNRGMAHRYAQMITLLQRMRGLGSLDGPFAADILSPASKARADAVIDSHRRALQRL